MHPSVPVSWVGAAALLLVESASPQAANETIVRQENRTFIPSTLTVPRGTTLHFVNDETIVHHAFVNAPGFSVDSGDIGPGETRELLFDKEGRFLVRCAIHPKMRVDVVVMP